MPVLWDVSLALDVEQVLCRVGIGKHSNLQAEIVTLLEELLAGVNDLHLLEPDIAYESYLIAEVRHDQVYLKNGTVLQGWLLPSLLSSLGSWLRWSALLVLAWKRRWHTTSATKKLYEGYCWMV